MDIKAPGRRGAFRSAPAAPRHAARGAALIVPAMGVAQAFYAPLASWLAELGVHAVTFDYRGTGRSRRGPLREVEADIVTWARLDTTAALRALQDLAPGLPLTWIGHSLGAQIIPFVPDRRELAKVITIAAGSGYWRENVAGLRPRALSFTDDEMMSERNTESLHGFYATAPTTLRRIAPATVGMPRIGHFGFFRPASREPLWEGVLRPELALR